MSMSWQKCDVDAEYTEAFHTKSFMDIWNQARRHHKSSSLTPSDFLLQPSQEALLRLAAAVGSGADFYDYLDATLQSSAACTAVLAAIDRTRSFHHAIRQLLLLLLSTDRDAASPSGELAAHIDLGNPLSSQNLPSFQHVHSLFPPLLARLMSNRQRLRRRAHVVRAIAIAAISLVGAAAVLAVLIATHAAAAVVSAAVAPAIASGRSRWWRRWAGLGWIERTERRADAAARGAYIVGRDMDTVSRMVRRMHDEVEHRYEVVRLVLASGEGEMVKEAVREMEMSEIAFQEQVEELEEHVYLCLLTINRSRQMVAEELVRDGNYCC